MSTVPVPVSSGKIISSSEIFILMTGSGFPSTNPCIDEPSVLVTKLKTISAPLESRIGLPFTLETEMPDKSAAKNKLITFEVPAAIVMTPESVSASDNGVVPPGRAASLTDNAAGLVCRILKGVVMGVRVVASSSSRSTGVNSGS